MSLHYSQSHLRSRRTNDKTRLDNAIENAYKVIELAPKGHSSRPGLLSDLGNRLSSRYSLMGDKDDLDKAIEVAQEAVDLTPGGDSEKSKRLNNLGVHHLSRYSSTGNEDSLHKAIQLTRAAVALTPEGCQERPKWLSNLGSCLSARYSLTREKADLDKAIETSQEAVDLTPRGYLDRAGLLNNLANRLSSRYTVTSDQADLSKAIEAAKEAVSLSLNGHTEKPKWLSNLASLLSARHSLTSEKADIDQAVEFSQQAVDLIPQGQIDRAGLLNNLANRVSSRYPVSHNISDLDKAIEATQEALDLTPRGYTVRPVFLNNLGAHFNSRYSLTSEKADLDKAIETSQEAVDLTPRGYLDRSGRLNNLANRLSSRYTVTSDQADLSKAIEAAQEAVSLSLNGHTEKPKWLSNLASLLSARHSLTSEKADIDQAVEFSQHAVNLTPTGHTEKCRLLNNFGNHLLSKYFVTSDKTDLDKAIETAQRALDLTPEGHNDKPLLFSNLGMKLATRHSTYNDEASLDNAILLAQKAVDMTPISHSDHPRYLNNLGSHFWAKCSAGRDTYYLGKAIQAVQRAVDLTPSDHIHLPTWLNNLGTNFLSRYILTSDPADFQNATKSFMQASNASTAIVVERLRAYKFLTRLFADDRQHGAAFSAGSKAIDLLPALAPHSLPASDKQRVLTSVVGLASDTAAMAVFLGRPLAAVQLLEQGRGVLLGNLTDLRSVPIELEDRYPDLAKGFFRLRKRLNMTVDSDQSISPTPRISPTRQGEARRQDNLEFEKLLQTIRQQPGFHEFLRPLDQQRLQEAASEGPIIYVNVSKYRCDALIICKDSIRFTPLDGLTVERLVNWRIELTRSGLQSIALLQWLWDSVASPILEDLGFHGNVAVHVLPRIWWIPTGLLSSFPLQAAGYHLAHVPRSVLDCVVSSFASSVKSILRSRSHTANGISENDSLALVAMQYTPACRELPSARTEAQEVKKLCQDFELRVLEPSHHKVSVLNALPSCKIFHFAGHGHSHPSDPLQSQLLLDDWQDNRLILAHFLEAHIFEQPPFLAYLSACGTGQIQDARMLDESLHLVNAFQLAGFRHVIGTLWDVDDELCAQVARIVYEAVLEEFTDKSVSLGLHNAIKNCRDRWRNGLYGTSQERSQVDLSPAGSRRDYGSQVVTHGKGLEWVPYVHFGG